MKNLRAAHQSRSTNFQVRPYHQRPSESMTEPTWTLEDRQTATAIRPGNILCFLSWLASYSLELPRGRGLALSSPY
ncbi:hypothetical protein Pcinc_004505 [Petrolisthes cinctipes]|uniref:Uncharacterized protein n=1 Tax=Petrolisthes cinctipes TaxID=88211 RepID=A0AAE1GGY8_PETCI|nr:hypothetical protein Pcinc_004505 [Petrolisthes cinctipes]